VVVTTVARASSGPEDARDEAGLFQQADLVGQAAAAVDDAIGRLGVAGRPFGLNQSTDEHRKSFQRLCTDSQDVSAETQYPGEHVGAPARGGASRR